MAEVLNLILLALQGVVIIDALLSWVKPNPAEFPRNLTTQITDPLYAPVRAILNPQKLGGLDISPIIIIFLLSGMRRMLAGNL